MDDDSPYFVKINLNQQFLSHLDEPSIVDSHELMGPPHRCHIIMQNRVFKEIVQTEAHNMFNKNIESVLKRHLTQQYQQLAPVGAGLVADPEQKQKRYAAINEESSCNSGKELNDGKGSMSQLEHEKSIDTIDRGSTGGNLIDEIATP
jgi:Zn-dependent oligopeptidase